MLRIIWELTGYYERQTINGTAVLQTSLFDLVTDLRAIATYQKHYQLPTIREKFGLQCLPSTAIAPLMEQTLDHSPLLVEQTLKPYCQDLIHLTPQTFTYRFVANNLSKPLTLKLDQNNSQLPPSSRFNVEHQCLGLYYCELPTTTKNSEIQKIYITVTNYLKELIQTQPVVILQLAQKSPDPQTVLIPVPHNCTIELPIQKLPKPFQVVLKILRQEINVDPNTLPLALKKLLQTYRSQSFDPAVDKEQIPNFVPAPNSPKTHIEIGKGTHRERLTQLIQNAQQFLLICSYRLEDQETIELIAKKSKTIPVWILTDFSNEVQNRVDPYMGDRLRINPEYINADTKKKKCLRILSQANLGFRSGNFHLKTYISEQAAYLGSCNLTGGSLGRNGEAGILWQNTPEHQSLIQYFRALWTTQTTAQAIPVPLGFRSETFERKPFLDLPSSSPFLDHHTFKKDLLATLKEFPKEEIWIYTRSFNPLIAHLKQLQGRKIHVFYGAYNNTLLTAQKIPNLHSKIIVIGSQVAYLGSQDCAFSYQPLIDLTYRTTNSSEITTIIQALKNLH